MAQSLPETAAVHLPAPPAVVDLESEDQDQENLDQQQGQDEGQQQGQDEAQQQVLKEARRQERAQLIEKLKLAHRLSTPRYQFQTHVVHLANRIARATYDPTEMPLHGMVTCAFDDLDEVEAVTRVRECLPYAEAIITNRWKNRGLWSEVRSETRLYNGGLDSPGIESRWEHERDTAKYDDFTRILDAHVRGYQHVLINKEMENSVSRASRPYNMFMAHMDEERLILLGLSKTMYLSEPTDPKGRRPEARRSMFLSMPESPIPESTIPEPDPLTISDIAYKHRVTVYKKQLLEIKANIHDLWQCAVGKAPMSDPPSTITNVNTINDQVYEITRGIWEEIGIWDPRWGVFPGLKWLHEEPLDEYLKRRLAEEGFPEEDEEEKEENRRKEEKEEEEAHNRLPLTTICSMLGKRKSTPDDDPEQGQPAPPQTPDGNANDNGLSTIVEAEDEGGAGSESQTATLSGQSPTASNLFGQQTVKRRRLLSRE